MAKELNRAVTASAQADGDMLYNVVRVEIEEIDPSTGNAKPSGATYKIKCDSEIGLEPVVNEGQVVVRRDSKSILARAKEEDLLESMNLTLTSVRFPVEVLAIVQGGTVKKGTGEDASKIVGYSAPTMSEGVSNKKQFKLTAYVENYSGDDVVNYVKFTFYKCKGKPISLDFKKDFFAPQFLIQATENTKISKPIYEFDYIATLPTA